MRIPQITFNKLKDGAELPRIKTKGSVGADLVCPVDVSIPPFHMVEHGTLVPLGFSLDIPEGFCVYIYPRSSTGLKTPLMISNSVGVIDTDYKGELGLILTNLSRNTIQVAKGTALAQMVVMPKTPFELIVPHYRGRKLYNPAAKAGKRSGGFGSTTTTNKENKGEVKKDET